METSAGWCLTTLLSAFTSLETRIKEVKSLTGQDPELPNLSPALNCQVILTERNQLSKFMKSQIFTFNYCCYLHSAHLNVLIVLYHRAFFSVFFFRGSKLCEHHKVMRHFCIYDALGEILSAHDWLSNLPASQGITVRVLSCRSL